MVFSTTLAADELAREIGATPDQSWNKGEPRPSGRTRARSMVRYNSGLPRETDPSEQIAALIDRLAEVAPRLRRLSELPHVEIRLCVGYFINESQWVDPPRGDGVVVRGLGVGLGLAEIERLAGMGAGFDLDIYVLEDRDDEEG